MDIDTAGPLDPALPCLTCNRYTCRCAEDVAGRLPLPRKAAREEDWTPWMSGAAANA